MHIFETRPHLSSEISPFLQKSAEREGKNARREHENRTEICIISRVPGEPPQGQALASGSDERVDKRLGDPSARFANFSQAARDEAHFGRRDSRKICELKRISYAHRERDSQIACLSESREGIQEIWL